MSKSRCSNYTKHEVEVLVGLVEKHKEVVECKKTDCTTNSMKDAEWLRIEPQFNSVCGTGRSSKMLRSKWDAMKKATKKEYAELRQRFYKTGGGPSAEVKLETIHEKILYIIGVGAKGTGNILDSDLVSDEVAPVPEMVPAPPIATMAEKEVVESMPSCSWRAWNPQQLKQPLSQPLRCSTPKSPPRDLLSADESAIAPHAVEVPPSHLDSKMTVSPLPKRKRSNGGQSTAAKLQKKRSGSVYEELARKKLEYVELQIRLATEEGEEKKRLQAEKHAVEMRILEAEAAKKELELKMLLEAN